MGYISTGNPLVTCCLPCFNHEKYVEEAIKSVIEQDFKNIQLIVLDDGSSDNSVAKIKGLETECKNRFVDAIFIYRENRGLSVTLNEMLQLSKGEYITFLASDDRFLPHKISFLVNQFKFLNDNKYCAIFGDATLFSEKNNKLTGSFIKKYNNSFLPDSDVEYEQILSKNFLPAVSALYTRKSLIYIGGFVNELRLEDWDLYLRLLQFYRIKVVAYSVAEYRLHDNNSIFIENVRLLKDTLEILSSQKKYSFSQGYKKTWFWKLYDTYYSLLRKKELSFKEVKFFSFNMLARYLFVKMIKRFRTIKV